MAIVHDFLNQRGGAERVVVTLAQMFPDAPIFTSVYDPRGTFSEFMAHDVRTSFLQRLPHSSASFRWLLPLYPFAFRSFDLTPYDLVISSSTNFAHAVHARGRHIVYCYNPPRWLYQTGEYLGEGPVSAKWLRFMLSPLLAAIRVWDRRAASRPDLYIAISKAVAERIKQRYGREAPVVYPPVEVERFSGVERKPQGSHYLVVSRLLPYKRVDLAVAACTRRKAPLVVVGDGPERRALERIAGPTVRFLGRIGDQDLLDLYSGAWALIHPGVEDFGLALLEANAAGVPCVTVRRGAALETVIHGVTGVLFEHQSIEAVNDALDEIESTTWDMATLRSHARRFDEAAFKNALLDAIEPVLSTGPKS